MGIYLINFLVYSMAMVGLLFVCLMVYKKTMVNNHAKKNTEDLSVENALNLSPRKMIYVIKAGDEKFLIAADAERTSFLAKLNSNKLQDFQCIPDISKTNPSGFVNKETTKNTVDYTEVMNSINRASHKQPVMKEILRKLDERENSAQT